jgi:hypothetical protein
MRNHTLKCPSHTDQIALLKVREPDIRDPSLALPYPTVNELPTPKQKPDEHPHKLVYRHNVCI